MLIFKRKKGKSSYFYLRHSFRQDGKTITKERYLGKEIPPNLEAIKKEFKKQFEGVLDTRLEAVKSDFQKEWKRIPEKVKEEQLKDLAVAFTYNTNAIEGSEITMEETREIIRDKISPHKPLRDIKETEAHAKIFLNMLKERGKISEDWIFQWHKEIFSETNPEIAGRYRQYLARVGDYLAPDWQDIPTLMKEFFEFLKTSEKSANIVDFSARAHYKFEKIHPFGDGNGRIGRLLMNYLLWKEGYPMLIIEYRGRRGYYKALKKDEDSFAKYFIRRYLAVHKKRFVLG